MQQSQFDTHDKAMLKKIQQIRSTKEDKLRRKMSQMKKEAEELVDKKQKTIQQRLDLITYIQEIVLPDESLSQHELAEFKIQLAKCYQDERQLAENVITIQQQIEEAELTIQQMNREILQLVKDQEKLQAVFDE